MADTTFPSITPSMGSKRKSIKPNVTTYAFGDEYTQRVANGLNTIREDWDIIFAGLSTADKDTVNAFLTARSGTEAFNWTPQGGTEKQFICQSWDIEQISYSLFRVTATFLEVFGE